MIDVPTLLAMLGLDCLVIALTVLAMSAGRMRDGQASWVAALLCQGCAYALFTWMAITPPTTAVIVLSVVLLSASVSLFAASMGAFARTPPSRTLLLAPPLLLGVQHLIWADDFHTRALAANAVIAAQLLLCCWPLLRAPGEGEPRFRWLVVASFILGSGSTLVRLGELVLAPERLPDLTVGEPINAGAFLLNHANLILGSLGIALMHRERNRAAAERLATRDSLTELFNHRSFMLQAAREVLRAERSEQALSVLMIDPDNFHQINSQYGSLSGDRVLQHLANAVRNTLRTQDLCARFGPEEIAILLSDTAAAGAHHLAERLREQISQDRVGPELVRYTVSIGVAELRAGEREPGAMLDRAEAALRAAKRDGRNRVATNAEVAA